MHLRDPESKAARGARGRRFSAVLNPAAAAVWRRADLDSRRDKGIDFTIGPRRAARNRTVDTEID
jgi:hypothetical protein